MDTLWKNVRKDYKLLEEMGQGSYGQVIKAMKRDTKQVVAIKLMKNIFLDSYQARKTLREIKILRKLSRIPNNLFTTALVDIILPAEMEINFKKGEEFKKSEDNDENQSPTKKGSSNINYDFGESSQKDQFEKFTHVFLVMELVESDMKKLLSSTPPVPLQEEHIITIIYNSLCALNYMHSANIIHRDIKPGNFLINSSCSVKICDFGLARTMPKKEDDEREFRDVRKKSYKKIDR